MITYAQRRAHAPFLRAWKLETELLKECPIAPTCWSWKCHKYCFEVRWPRYPEFDTPCVKSIKDRYDHH